MLFYLHDLTREGWWRYSSLLGFYFYGVFLLTNLFFLFHPFIFGLFGIVHRYFYYFLFCKVIQPHNPNRRQVCHTNSS